MAETPLRIVVLGGGTAGWMAANLLAKRWSNLAQITVIESSEIGTVGVGEGSTPQMRGFFNKLGIAEDEWMPRCHATFKTGIRFNGWSRRQGYQSYFHPFRSDLDSFTTPTFYLNTVKRRHGQDVPAHPDPFSLLTHLADRRLAPRAPENFPFKVLYGYHFDAGLLGNVLRDHAVGLGVAHVDRKVSEIEVAPNGEVQSLVFDGGERIEGDLFFDASGFRSIITQEKLGVRFIPFENNLFNDSAVVFPTEASADGAACHTVAATLKNGWAWRIPLTHRVGNGYVYSSRYCSPAEAEAEFRDVLGLGKEVEARHLKMKVGKTERAWNGNVVAIGLAQSFIEPLEATALMIVQRSVDRFIHAYEKGGFTPQLRDSYNHDMDRLSENIRDYIVCHYKVNGRRDTDYWRDAAGVSDMSDGLRGILEAWFAGKDIRHEIKRNHSEASAWGDLPWHCLLAGYGCFPADKAAQPVPPKASDLSSVNDFIRRCGLNFRKHEEVLAELGAAA